jgi:hypothetical protein
MELASPAFEPAVACREPAGNGRITRACRIAIASASRAATATGRPTCGCGCGRDRGLLSLRVTTDMLAGNTGCAAWEAGLVLAEALLR